MNRLKKITNGHDAIAEERFFDKVFQIRKTRLTDACVWIAIFKDIFEGEIYEENEISVKQVCNVTLLLKDTLKAD